MSDEQNELNDLKKLMERQQATLTALQEKLDRRAQVCDAQTRRVVSEAGGEPQAKKVKKELEYGFVPDFLKNLNELIEIYEKEGDFRATGLTKAAQSLQMLGHIISSVDDIEMYKLKELSGVGSSTIEMLQEFINDGKIERLEKLRPQPKASPDQLEWFATLTKEQACFLVDYWDQEGEKRCEAENGVFGSCGIPFTFEHEGDTYKVEGEAEDEEWEGRCTAINFEGTVHKNGVEYASFSMSDAVDGFHSKHGGTFSSCVLLNEEEEVTEDDDLAEACREAFRCAYTGPTDLQMAYYE